MSDGLSNNQVTCIFKDSRGFMWIGTSSGLNRYDGYNFRVFKHNSKDTTSIHNNSIVSIDEDSYGRLWVRTTVGYSIYNPGSDSFSQVAQVELNRMGAKGNVDRVYIDCRKNIWIRYGDGKSSGNVGYYNFDKKSFTTLPIYTVGGKAANVMDIYSRNGKVWILYQGGDVACYRLNGMKPLFTNSLLRAKYHAVGSNSIFIDSREDIWLTSYSLTEGAFWYSTARKEWVNFRASDPVHHLSSSMIMDVAEDLHGDIWIGTDHGGINVIDFRTGGVTYLKNDPLNIRTIAQNSVVSLYCDNLGIMWAGTYKQGLSYVCPFENKFKVSLFPTRSADDYQKNDCNSFYEDKSGTLWVGTNGGGLIKYPQGGGAPVVIKEGSGPGNVSGNIVVSIKGDSKGRVWVGSYMGGLDCYSGGSFKHYKHDPANPGSLSSNSIYHIYEDRSGRICVGTLDGSFDIYDEATGSFIHYKIPSNLIYRVLEDPDGSYLLATPIGIVRVDRKTGKSSLNFYAHNGKEQSVSTFSYDIFIDSRKLMWIATSEGISVFNYGKGEFEDISQISEYIKDNIVTIVEDKEGTIWLGSLKGLYCLKTSVDPKGKVSCDIKKFDETDGLQSDEFNVNAAFLTAKGEVIVGGPGGFNRFDPKKLSFNKTAPKVVFTDFSVLNSSVSKGESVRSHIGLQNNPDKSQTINLRYNERNITLQFAALTYYLPQKNRYKYILEGFDKQWTEINATQRKVTYTNLNPGTYTFKVLACNNDGVWMSKPAELVIVVKPPFWGTTFAYLIYILLIVWGIYHIVQFFIRRQHRRFIEEQERFETQKLLDLDEMKIQFFTNISHELRTPLTLILSPVERLLKKTNDEEDKKLLATSHNNAIRLLGMVNQLLDFRKLDANAITIKKSVGDLVPFVQEICQDFSELANKKHVELRFDTNLGSVYVEFDQEKMYKAVSNIISNALKYTPDDGNVSVSMEVYSQGNEEKDLLHIKICDTGIGISDENCSRIFERFYRVESDNRNITGTGIGLHLAYEFVKMHGGDIQVQSELGKGSCFTIILPIENGQYAQEENAIQYTLNAIPMEPQEQPEVEVPKRENVPTLLVVDDNDEFRDFMVSMLSDQYNVATAVNGVNALEVVWENIPDLILSDVMMPEMDGFELCRKIQQDIRTSHIPIILLTAKTGNESKIEGLESGANDYISKPFSMEELLLKIKRLLDLRRISQKKFQQKREIQSSEIAISSLDEKLMKKAADYVEANLANADLSVEDLSSHLAMSRVHLYKKLTSITGKTPIEFIRILRLKRAAQLLEKSQLPVSEVAYNVGFNDPKYFRRYFKDEYGMLPSEYKQKFERNDTLDVVG